ncbi:MAG: hypothetical protein K0R50_3801 [Eubacterium sp.]|jgi:hypothetical protein|nr:hypothetical protein [Eubacterium sp.]
MSTVLMPFIDHNSINHKFYLRADLGDNTFKSTCFWSGIYPTTVSDEIEICASFLEKLLCYDKAVITVDDYLFLARNLENDLLKALINDEAIEIYNNYGIKAGMSSFADEDPITLSFHLNKSFDCEQYLEDYQRIYNCKFSDTNLKSILNNLTSLNNIDVDDTWIKELNEETINDIGNEAITRKLGLINDGKIINRDRDYNQFLYNRLAYLNLYLSIGNKLKIIDVSLPDEIQTLLDAKIGAYIKSPNNNILEGYTKIIENSGILDIPSLVTKNILSFNDIFEIRKSKRSIDFRKWLENASRSFETRDMVEMYNQANSFGDVLKVSREKNYVKTLKFAIPSVIGFIPIVGGYISTGIGTKMYISDMINNNYKPKIFVEKYLKKFTDHKMIEYKIKSENDYLMKVHGKIYSNDRCPCGSGKKYKKCHGV